MVFENSNISIYSFPFGMQMPDRNGGQNDYRYGFNGFEGDDEVKGNGNSYTTMFRSYDPRLGRWLSPDPITHPQYSPYSAFDNNPIYYSDPSGANSEKKGDGDKKKGSSVDDTWQGKNSDGSYTGKEEVLSIEEIEIVYYKSVETPAAQADATYFNTPAPNFNLGIDYSRFLEKSWDFHTSYESADIIAGGSVYTTVHYPPAYGTWDNGPIIETGYTGYGGHNASINVGMSFEGKSTLAGDEYINNSLFSMLQAGAKTEFKGSGFGGILNYNEEWSTTYSKNNNAFYLPLYNSHSYGASLGLSVHPLGNYTYGKVYTTAIKQVNGVMTQKDSINKMTENMTHENAGKMLKDMEKTIGRKRTDSIVNSFFGE